MGETIYNIIEKMILTTCSIGLVYSIYNYVTVYINALQ